MSDRQQRAFQFGRAIGADRKTVEQTLEELAKDGMTPQQIRLLRAVQQRSAGKPRRFRVTG